MFEHVCSSRGHDYKNNLDFSQIVSTTIHILPSHYQVHFLTGHLRQCNDHTDRNDHRPCDTVHATKMSHFHETGQFGSQG